MATEKNRKGFEKPQVDEEYLMNIMSGDQPVESPEIDQQVETENQKGKLPQKQRKAIAKKADFEQTFLVNRFPSSRNGKVVYIRPEYHERLQRIVQLTREEKITLYSYIDNILEHHFKEFGDDITDFFTKKYKPIF